MKRVIALLLLMVFSQLAFGDVTDVTFDVAPAATFGPGDKNALVMKIDIADNGSGDTLESISLKNGGTVTDPDDAIAIKLWYQPAGGAFNAGSAVYVTTVPATATKTWADSSFVLSVVNGGSLYITMDVSANPSNATTMKMTILKNGAVFTNGGTYPNKNTTNADTQTVLNPPKLSISYTDIAPAQINAGQQDAAMFQIDLLSSNVILSNITDVRLYAMNHAGAVPLNSVVSRIVLTDLAGAVVADTSVIPATNYIDITLTGTLGISANSPDSIIVRYYLLPGINTKDVGVRFLQADDIIIASGIPKEAKMGYSFPMDSSLSEIVQPVGSVDLSSYNIVPLYVSEEQTDVEMILLRFTHPQAVTTYADCKITGVTLTAGSFTSLAFLDSDLFTDVKVFDDAQTYVTFTNMLDVNDMLINFDTPLLIPAGGYKDVTVSVSLKQNLAGEDLYVYIATTAEVYAYDGSDNSEITVNGTGPFGSSTVTVQTPPTGAGTHHINEMPTTANTGQSWVYVSDLIFTHPNTGNFASIEIRGVTITVEDNLGNGIIPSDAISGITILDSANNTVSVVSSIPVSGTTVYAEFSSPIVIVPTASETFKIYTGIVLMPNETFVKFNINSNADVNVVDANTGLVVVVFADNGDSFPMKTSTMEILNAAIDVKVKHVDTAPNGANMGQQEVKVMTYHFLNDQGGVVAIEGLTFRFSDNASSPVSANTVIDNIRVDDFDNTITAYVDTAVASAATDLTIPFTTPLLVNFGDTAGTTINVKFNIANPATAADFKISAVNATYIDSHDYNTGLTLTAIANDDVFPMDSGLIYIEEKATDLNVSHDGTNLGVGSKGDTGYQVMELIFENPGGVAGADVLITGVTLTVEDNTIPINADYVFSKVYLENAQTSYVYDAITSIPTSEFLYFALPEPISIPAGAGNNITINVKADIASFALASVFKLNLENASMINAEDENQATAVAVAAKSPDSFPDMESDLVTIGAANKVAVLHTNTMPATVSQGQPGISPMNIRFANATASPLDVHRVVITVEDIANAGMIPDTVIDAVYLVDDAGNTKLSTAAIESAGDTMNLIFTSDLNVAASSFKTLYVYVDLKTNTFNTSFKLNLAAVGDVETIPGTITVVADSGDVFPMRTSAAQTQYIPVQGGIAHTDVIPTTVSTGQTDIFAEILSIQNANVTGTADVMLTGITITVEDDTNTVINPATAIKRIMLRDTNTVYTFFSAIPAAVGSFYVSFDTPVSVSVAQTKDLKLYVDIVDTLSAGSFQINIKIDSDLTFKDGNSRDNINAVAINGDSFPMKTSTVIIQDNATDAKFSFADLMPVAVNKSQQGIQAMKLTISNEGSVSGANLLITRMIFSIEDNTNMGIIPKTALTRFYIKDASGTVFGNITTIPDFGDSISVGLTTPITVQVGEQKEVFVMCEINGAATAPGYKVNLKTASGVLARDANSYEIINISAISGYSFPMRSAYAEIQSKSDSVEIHHYKSITSTVNKGDMGVETMYLEFINSNPAGSSTVQVMGVTITVENNIGSGIIPSDVITELVLVDSTGTTFGSAASIPSSGSSVYIPLTQSAFVIPAGTQKGVTLFADVSAVTTDLYLQFDLKTSTDVTVVDINSNDEVSSVSADAGDSFPMRSGVTTINSLPGIEVLHTDLNPVSVSGGQTGSGIISYRFDNIGSFDSDIEGITLTVKNSDGSDADASLIFSKILVVDDYSNTVTALDVMPAGAKVYLPMSITAFTVSPQDYLNAYVFIDFLPALAAGSYYMGVSLGADVETSSPVNPNALDTFPMYSGVFEVQNSATGLNISRIDRMPPAVSSEQVEVPTFELLLQSPDVTGHSAVVLYGVTLTVQDSLLAPLNADKAIARVLISDASIDYTEASIIPSVSKMYISLPQPVTIAPGETKNIIFKVDITGNTITMANDFKLLINSASDLLVKDYNSGSDISILGTFPASSSSAVIQKKADNLGVALIDVMPANVSTDQEDVTAMNIVLTDIGDSSTSAIKISRINFYIQDDTNLDIAAPSDVVKKIKVTSQDGVTVYGSDVVLSSTKTSIILTQPIIVPSASSLTVSVRVDVASIYAFDKFKVSLDTASDVYALDANSNELITSIIGTFPMRSSSTGIEEDLPIVYVNSFTDLLGVDGVTKGDTWVPLFVFKIDGSTNTLSANSEFKGITITVKDASDTDISGNTVIENLYIVDGDGNTLGTAVPGVSNLIPVQFAASHVIAPSTYNYVTVYADILNAATASDFKVELQNGGHISIVDENSDMEITKNNVPALPWETIAANVYDSPATDLHVWTGLNLGQGLVGVGVPNVQFMSLSFYNPGGPGTSEVVVEGVSITVSNNLDVTLIPQDILDKMMLTDATGNVIYGETVTTALSTAVPVYVDLDQPILVDASNTKTVYVRADIATVATLGLFKLRVVSQADVDVHNNPVGSVVVIASNGKSFPLISEPATNIKTETYNIDIGHKNLMPVSVAKGQIDVPVLQFDIKNKNTVNVDIRGVTLTVKDSRGSELPASDVIDRIKIKVGESIYADIIPSVSGKVFVSMTGLTISAAEEASFDVLIDIKNNAKKSFYIEFEIGSDLLSAPPANVQAAAGDYFGNMKSSLVSLQEANFEDSFHAFPSPFNPEVEVMHIEYYLDSDSEVTIKLFTLDGKLVKTVIDKIAKTAGLHFEDTWDALNGLGGMVKSGVYLCVIDVDGKKLIRKVVVLR